MFEQIDELAADAKNVALAFERTAVALERIARALERRPHPNDTPEVIDGEAEELPTHDELP